MDIFEAIKSRRSVGLTKGTVSDRDLQTIIEAATWAPNHRMTQPWRFTAINGDTFLRLGERLAELENDPGQKKKLERSPAAVVVSYVVDAKPDVAQEDRDATAAAIQNMLLTAHAMGFGAIWRTGSYVRSEHFARLIRLPENEQVVALIGIGEPAISPVVQVRDIAAVTRILTEIP
jgi:nitroreductase